MRPARSEHLTINGLRYHVRRWGPADAPPLFLFHGRMDSSASFQFVVDALAGEWQVVAPDWRGYGDSEWLHRPYWFPDYLVDLDCLLAHYCPGEAARLVGHSMGANVVTMYAAARPERVSRLVLLDFLGLPTTDPDEAPGRLAQWLTDAGTAPRMRCYDDFEALARRLQLANPRLTPDRADFLARHTGRRFDDGRVRMACDPWHKLATPILYRVEEAMAFWRAIRVPTLLLIADRGIVHRRFGEAPDELERRIACFAQGRVVTITDSGHNLQHDQPEKVAAGIASFLAERH